MTNPFILEMLFNEKENITFVEKCYHQGACKENKNGCNLKNPDPKTKKAVNYIDQCCCINNPCINSYGFTSDPFKKQHDSKHILFAGCSYTHGSGMTLEEIWAYNVYKKICEEEKISGFFNIGFPNTSIHEQSFMILKYFEKFGHPEILFWLMPPTSRGYSNFASNDLIQMPKSSSRNGNIDSAINEMYTEVTKKKHPSYHIDLNELANYIAYYQVYSYCKTNNIKIYSFTWQAMKKEIDEKSLFFDFSKIKQFKTFHVWEKEILLRFYKKLSAQK
jgi:hypothetical protein